MNGELLQIEHFYNALVETDLRNYADRAGKKKDVLLRSILSRLPFELNSRSLKIQ